MSPLLLLALAVYSPDTPIDALPCARVALVAGSTAAVGFDWATELEPELWIGLVRWRACAVDAENRAEDKDREIQRRIEAPPPPPVQVEAVKAVGLESWEWALIGAGGVVLFAGGIFLGVQLAGGL